MRFTVRTKIGDRLGKGGSYSLRDICISLVDRYSLKETEIVLISRLVPGMIFQNEDMTIRRDS